MAVEIEQDLKSEVKEIRGHVEHLALEIPLLRETIRTNVQSRRGLDGAH